MEVCHLGLKRDEWVHISAWYQFWHVVLIDFISRWKTDTELGSESIEVTVEGLKLEHNFGLCHFLLARLWGWLFHLLHCFSFVRGLVLVDVFIWLVGFLGILQGGAWVSVCEFRVSGLFNTIDRRHVWVLTTVIEWNWIVSCCLLALFSITRDHRQWSSIFNHFTLGLSS